MSSRLVCVMCYVNWKKKNLKKKNWKKKLYRELGKLYYYRGYYEEF